MNYINTRSIAGGTGTTRATTGTNRAYASLTALPCEEMINSLFDELTKQHFLDSATGEHLDHLGQICGIHRKEEESDKDFRAHLIKSFRLSSENVPQTVIEKPLTRYDILKARND